VARGIDPKTPVAFVLERDRSLDPTDPERSEFDVVPLGCADEARIQDATVKIHPVVSKPQPRGVEAAPSENADVDVNMGLMELETLLATLRDVRKFPLPGGSVLVWPANGTRTQKLAALDCIAKADRSEVYSFVKSLSVPSVALVGKSASPSNSGEPAASTASGAP